MRHVELRGNFGGTSNFGGLLKRDMFWPDIAEAMSQGLCLVTYTVEPDMALPTIPMENKRPRAERKIIDFGPWRAPRSGAQQGKNISLVKKARRKGLGEPYDFGGSERDLDF